MAVELGSERLCCNHTRQFLCHHWRLMFDKCDERRYADLTLSNLDTQTAGRKQVVNHLRTVSVSYGAILVPTTEGHMRLERARDRFAQFAEEPGVMESSRKRHRPEGEGRQPLAPSTSGVRSNYQEGGSSSSGSALPPPPPSLEPPPLAKRSLEQETEVTDATVEQQGESKRRREHPEVPQAADSSGSSSSESSTDTEMGLMDACTIHCASSSV